jgi:hypothetical protein
MNLVRAATLTDRTIHRDVFARVQSSEFIEIGILISEAAQLFFRRLPIGHVLKGAGFVFRERWRSRFDGIIFLSISIGLVSAT